MALSMETAAFEKGAKKTESTIGRLKGFLLGPAGLAAGAGAVGAALGKLAATSIKTADDIFKAAQSIGIGTEELSRLRYAAELSGVSVEGLQKALLRQSRVMSDAQNGLATAARSFEQLGISVTNTDGTLRTNTEVLFEMADRFSKMEDGAKKAALAQEVFGRAGADMIPFLNQGREGIEKLTAEAENFGIVIDEETGRRAEAFNDNLSRLTGAASALGTRIAAELLPHLLDFTNWLIANSDTLAQHVGTVARWGKALVDEVTYTLNEFKYLWDYAGYLDSRLPWWLGGTGKNLSAPVNQNRVNELKAAADQAVALAQSIMGVGRASSRTVPTFEPLAIAAEGAGSRGGKAIKSGLSDSMREAQREAETLARLMDQLFPEEKVAEEFRGNLARIDAELEAGKISAERHAAAVRALYGELARNGISERPRVDLPDVGPIADVDAGLDALDRFVKKADDARVRIAKSFKDMADETIGAFSRLTSAIQSGGFLGILEGLLGLGLQLGSIGVFGKTIANNLNRTIPGNANGTSFWGGGLSWVGERGPELVNLPRGSQVFSNKDSRSMMGGIAQIVPSPYFDVVVDGHIMRAAPGIASAGGQVGVQRMQYANTRRVG